MPHTLDRWYAAGYNVHLIGHHDNSGWPWVCDIRRHYPTIGSISPEALAGMNGQYVTGHGETADEAIGRALAIAATHWPGIVEDDAALLARLLGEGAQP